MLETFYTILGVEEDATAGEIKKAYKKKAIQYHPDKVNNLGDKIKMVAEMESKRINEAKEVLLDEKKRKEYDESLHKRDGTEHKPPTGWTEGDVERPVPKEIEDYRVENEALHNLIVSLNFEITNLSNELESEKLIRKSMEEKLKDIAGDKSDMGQNLELLTNILDELIYELTSQKNKTENEFEDLQKQLIEIQGLSLHLLENLPKPYYDLSNIQDKLDAIRDWREIAVSNLMADEVESVRIQAERSAPEKTESKWAVPEIKETLEHPEHAVEMDHEAVDSELRNLEDLGAQNYEHIYEEAVQQSRGYQTVATFFKQCPFCRKEIGSNQTYCYYCGAVF
ncbi:MAG: DnaJ domain-containing protein [Thermoplasmata archaeon]|nr:MAG: DnaJ domain-containing protein [Thermoplasmata archaeon]